MTCASPRRHSSAPDKYSSARPNASVENSTLSNGATSSGLSYQLQGAQAAVRDGRAGIEPYVRVHMRQVARLPVIGVAVQQHDLRVQGLHRLDEPGHPSGVATVQHDVGVAKPDVELQRQAEINPGPQDVPEQDRVVKTGLSVLRASAQPVPRSAR
jgi:hypothetical protein